MHLHQYSVNILKSLIGNIETFVLRPNFEVEFFCVETHRRPLGCQ